MPCWYYDKKELRNTPSFKDNIDPDTESRYRREGARFVLDCGTKLGLRYDTCGTGAIYFHRFYMFRSFREFHRYVTACACLFLAGKVEETPKKCKDLIRTTKSMLTESQFNKVFSDDPKEEILLVERILLQTLRFDLMVEHPYAHLLRYGKLLKGEKNKVQKMVQMSWTFINDSLCTTLCLQWEAEVIGVALIYLATRLSKVDIHDWEGKPPGYTGKWWEHLINEVTLELLEDICHQVLDLYSQQMSAEQASKHRPVDSPPPPPPPRTTVQTPSITSQTPASKQVPSSQPPSNKRSRSNTPVEVSNKKFKPQTQPPAVAAVPAAPPQQGNRIETITTGRPKTPSPSPVGFLHQGAATNVTPQNLVSPSKPIVAVSNNPPQGATVPALIEAPVKDGETYNPFVSTYSSSFMSGEGSKSIQTLMGGRPATTIVTQPSVPYPNYPPPNYSQPTHNVQSQQSYPPSNYQPPRPHYNQPPPPLQSYSSRQTNYHHSRTGNNNYSQGSGYQQQSYGGGGGGGHSSYMNQSYDKQSSGNYSSNSGGYQQNQHNQHNPPHYYQSHHQNYQHQRGGPGAGPHHRQRMM